MDDDLDCNSPRGRLFIARQHEIIHECADAWHCQSVHTVDSRESPVDVLFNRDGALLAVAEIKARDMTRSQLASFGSYLVTYRKLQEGVKVATALCVPYLLVVGLYPEQIVVWWTITNRRGQWLLRPSVRFTETQETCNGGSVSRQNAYLPLDRMHSLVAVPAEPALQSLPPITAADINW